ncbi:MAG: hypothetical protein JSS98_03490 [Bacteroidetes bacterium]|nr:hypothetical protein [Bacteroidota bacterium]
MTEQGHGNHWNCVDDIDNVLQNILPSIVQEGTKVEASEIFADCFENETPSRTKIFSITDEAELTAKILIATNQRKQTNEVISGYPPIQSKSSIRLKITKIHEWQNHFEAIITSETEDGHSISFFDTNYFLQKESYQIGKTHYFSVFALGYNIEILNENSFSFEGQEAIDWLAKSGKEPTHDENGNIEPVVFYLNELVAFLPTNENHPDDVEFQSPINSVETIQAFGKNFYKIRITIFRDPDLEIDLYSKADFFDKIPQVNDTIRGIIWLQGHKELGNGQY